MKTIIILGSSRKEGETSKIVNEIIDNSNWHLVDLNDYEFSYYDYQHRNRNDEFLPLMTRLIEKVMF